MKQVEEYEKIFEKYGGMMRTKQLQAEKILYRPLQRLIRGMWKKSAMDIINGSITAISVK